MAILTFRASDILTAIFKDMTIRIAVAETIQSFAIICIITDRVTTSLRVTNASTSTYNNS